MHELSISQNLLELALKHANQAGASRIIDITLEIGELSTVLDDSVQFYWDMISAGTIAEGAQLHFERIAAKMECLGCRHTYLLKQSELSCPECDSINVAVIAGDEFLLKSIEVETDQVAEPA
ncbi:MAG: hydrogenase maturation nickel metallochaperone HypA [Anaerolineae bacterium]|nr:hydrogenase maturation nickel metallochaperone HypA [Anaerolineae bacterium]